MKNSARILLVDDDAAFRRALAMELEASGFEVVPAGTGAEAVRNATRLEPDVVLLDLRLPDADGIEVLRSLHEACPGSEVIMLTGHGNIDTAIEAIRKGAFDFVTKPCPLDELEIRIQRALERRSLRRRTSLLERGLTIPDLGQSFVGESPAFRRLLQLIDRAAASDSTVLLSGETGTGKELVAKLLHARSPRRGRPFVVIECAALQEGLLLSELFGHERGAFTGAERAKPGLFEVAHGGTIFLDEIGEISHATQVKLLRVLDTSTFRHVGGTAEIHVDVRVIAATNRDLPSMVRQGRFREDLYYRLSTIAIELPPLRERAGDVELLATHFTRKFNERYGFSKRIAPGTLEVLRCHSWPGNLRELLHAIEAAMVVCNGSGILPAHLPEALRESVAASRAVPAEGAPGSAGEPGRLLTLQEVERARIERALSAAGGHRGKAAKILGISERNLYRKLQEYRLLP